MPSLYLIFLIIRKQKVSLLTFPCCLVASYFGIFQLIQFLSWWVILLMICLSLRIDSHFDFPRLKLFPFLNLLIPYWLISRHWIFLNVRIFCEPNLLFFFLSLFPCFRERMHLRWFLLLLMMRHLCMLVLFIEILVACICWGTHFLDRTLQVKFIVWKYEDFSLRVHNGSRIECMPSIAAHNKI